ncbi:entericidin A [Salmonella enterica]|nr:entericidin A [Salmonella enterica]
MMKRFICLVALVLLTGTLLTACNTARGFGEDIQHLGTPSPAQPANRFSSS